MDPKAKGFSGLRNNNNMMELKALRPQAYSTLRDGLPHEPFQQQHQAQDWPIAPSTWVFMM